MPKLQSPSLQKSQGVLVGCGFVVIRMLACILIKLSSLPPALPAQVSRRLGGCQSAPIRILIAHMLISQSNSLYYLVLFRLVFVCLAEICHCAGKASRDLEATLKTNFVTREELAERDEKLLSHQKKKNRGSVTTEADLGCILRLHCRTNDQWFENQIPGRNSQKLFKTLARQPLLCYSVKC